MGSITENHKDFWTIGDSKGLREKKRDLVNIFLLPFIIKTFHREVLCLLQHHVNSIFLRVRRIFINKPRPRRNQ